MSIKDKIRAEIERRMFEDYNGPDAEQDETAQGVCAGLLAFLDSLPEQPDGLEEKDFVEEVRQYYSNNCTWDALKQPMLSIITRCARHFAEWGRKQVLQEIYEGKVKPVDKITAAWLDDEQNT